MSLGITRMGHIALRARDPEAAAVHAEKLGFTRVHANGDGSHYLRAHGPDPFSLVYVPADDGPGMHHAAYLVPDDAALEAAAAQLAERGVEVQRADDPCWGVAHAVRFRTPAGHLIQLQTGVHTDVPVAALADTPSSAPAPIAPDHVGLGAINFEIEEHFVAQRMGLLHSSRINSAGGPQVMSFMRVPGRQLYHQLVVVRSHLNELHHLQFTLKSVDSFYATRDALAENGIEVEWGPLRHGPGHNIAMYFRDHEGHWIEYSVEEEIVLDDETYVPRTWSTADPHVVDEWNSGDPPKELMGPPPEQAEKFAKLGARMAQMARTQLWVCLSRAGHGDPDAVPPPSPQIDDILAHLEWALRMEAEGRLFAAGPFKNAQGGMQGDGLLIFHADSEAEARELAASDPIHARGFRTFELLQWELHEGRLDPSLGLLSTQEAS
jgi:catechol 2,3-dioxygenase-like lactoylglutathione lyase family enzyme/uncharacterized protein YciI